MNYFGDSPTLDVHIRRLGLKLGDPALIETVTAIGYPSVVMRGTGREEERLTSTTQFIIARTPLGG